MRISDWSSDVCSSDLLFVDRLWRHGTFTITVIGITVAALCSGFLLSAPDTDGVLFGMVATNTFGQYMRILIATVCLLFAEIGRPPCRERVCNYVYISVLTVSLKKKPTPKKSHT